MARDGGKMTYSRVKKYQELRDEEKFDENKVYTVAVPREKYALKQHIAFSYPQWKLIDCDSLDDAADMAIYDHSSSSPMYGDLNALVSRYHCTTSHASENIWKASTKTAAQIHTRFQANTGSRKVRMSSGYTEVGIAIVEKNNQTYVAEIYLK